MKNRSIVNFIFTFILILVSIPLRVSAEISGGELFEKLSIEDGLSNECVTSIFQDSMGYIWIGTQDGLNRFDGERVKVYKYTNHESKGLSSTYIIDIEEDGKGNIWIATHNGLDVLIRDTDEIIRIKDVNNNFTHLGETRITKLLYSSNEENIMWVGTESGLIKINVKNKEVEKTYIAKDDINSLTNSHITDLEEDEENNLLYVGTTYGINIIDCNSNIIYNSKKLFNEKLYIYDIEEDIYDNIWALTNAGIIFLSSKENSDNLAWLINYKEIKSFNIHTGELHSSYDNEKGVDAESWRCILGDSRGDLWISTYEGIVRYSKENRDVELINRDDNNNNSLSSNYVNCFYEDSNGTIWIGTEKGVNILNRDKQFSSVSAFLDENGVLNDNTIVSIHQNNGEIWIATKFNGIYVYDEDSKKLISRIYENDNLSLRNSYIVNLFNLNDKYMAVVTNKDIFFIDINERILKQYFSEKGYISELKYAYVDGEIIWIVTSEGFYAYNLLSEKFINNSKYLEDYNINPSSITYILPDNIDQDILWLAGINTGVIKYSKDNGVIERYTNNHKGKNSLISNHVTCMNFDNKGNLWIGTNVGLSKFDLNSKKFISYTIEHGLTDNFINSILVDDNNNIWVSTNKGLNRINIEDEEITHYGKMDGIIGPQFCLNSSIKLDNGYMIFGSTNGITYFNPNEIIDTKMKVHELVIGDIFIGKNKVVYNGNEIVLDYNNKGLYVEFFLPNYESLNNITYEYMIEGLDTEWIYIDSRSHLDIKYLETGKYTLKLRARDGHGHLTKETIMNLRIKKPIWKSNIAYTIYVIILLIIIIYILNYVKILHSLVEKKTLKLNKQLEENKRLSEEIINKEKFKNNYFVNLSHELRTPINVIFSTTQLIDLVNREDSMTKDTVNKYMNIISKNCSNLLKIINDIIDTSKIETGHYKINKQDNDIVYIVEEAALNMSKYIEDKGLSLIIDPDMEEKIVNCDENEIERCVINLLGNAVKFTPEGGEIKVYIKEVDNYIEVIVEDTGIGISKEDQEFIFNRFSQVEDNKATKASSSGIGLALVKHIANLHDGYIKLESEINKGSKFIIGIPNIVDGEA